MNKDNEPIYKWKIETTNEMANSSIDEQTMGIKVDVIALA